MRHLGLNTWAEYLRCGSLDPWGQPYPNPDENPGALASGNLEFFWCGKDPDVGITRNVGDGKDLYGQPNDGHQ